LQLGTGLAGGDDRREATGYKPTASDLQQGDLASLLAKMPEILRAMLHHPKLFASPTDVGIRLLKDDALSPRERELAILRIGWLCQAPYRWGEHVSSPGRSASPARKSSA
jgi:alkylhydroperoxidase family enzyme